MPSPSACIYGNCPDLLGGSHLSDIGLALANVDDDNFGFWALQHPNSGQSQPTLSDNVVSSHPLPPGLTTESADFCNAFVWMTPEKPCGHCSIGGFSCKIIQKGWYKGYCTSCVALRCDLLSASLSESSQQPFFMPSSAEMGPLDHGLDTRCPPPMIGTRFSRESVEILKNWLSSHSHHPYPDEKEKEMLQGQTGLNKTQIANWLANARRRGKTQPTKLTPPHVRNNRADPIDIPHRPGTPAFDSNTRNISPLERWVDSPPENEPASVTAIATAVALNSDISFALNSPHSFAFSDDSSNRSFYNISSASSAGTSSGGSFASAYWHGSFASAYWHGSFGSVGSMTQQRSHRRRRKRAAPKREKKTSLATPLKTFECTFCTETSRTKHDWHRHEKSLHLSLERWICAPDGPRGLDSQSNRICCVFCGEVEPNDAHIQSHNHSACPERSLEERTFFRKDHLNQHLRLVHGVKFLDCMKSWKVASPEIRSRCGFCGIRSISRQVILWLTRRATGVLMPLCLVCLRILFRRNERRSPFPFIASGAPVETPRSAYDLIKLELEYFTVNHEEKMGTLPSDEDMQLEACRIIFASEVLSLQGISATTSLAKPSSALCVKNNGEDNLFEQCPLEQQLHEYLRAKPLLSLTTMDDNELQLEACCIVGRIEEAATPPSDFIADWLIRLTTSSTSWLASFRQHAQLPSTEDMADCSSSPTAPNVVDSTIHKRTASHGYRALGRSPPAPGSYHHLRWLNAFKQRHSQNPKKAHTFVTCDKPETMTRQAQRRRLNAVAQTQPARALSGGCSAVTPAAVAAFLGGPSGQAGKQGAFLLTDANCYRRLARELTRFVSSTMSPNNPNWHVPTDAEIQHQARWILFDDDDPWNQTAADNAEWLLRFKRDAGILPPGPGLTLGTNSWNLSQGGTGFAPPYAFPGKRILHAASTTPASTDISGGTNTLPAMAASTAALDKYIETFASRYERPAAVLCSRELETGLVRYVKADIAGGTGFPSDEALKLRGRHIVGSKETAADDPTLLGKFKVWVMSQLRPPQEQQQQQQQQPMTIPSALCCDSNINLTHEEIDNVLTNISFK
ncbi:uncharacterized protein NECHADRAFT_97913 [Fusarium vanettenii 77-13-4]|uniref:Homeobox domain-containing protein n=1 Tax=Fusarium vanettenii (strain ATCC MYA-4622 / CBS 123669 / FGSC 9596 / NRRL 45880 / 77-13-4) TaxID=660122 RepID=C7ZN79_FUSV7|nr:uncharacterized protein NECHADRAFT_97913 [Fusarium vanettenii 77-13-4]EEU34521.1 hypothetical protein NECHADRAFT_97913 [Fusarium vanettenii 77-13-4]